MIAEIIAVGTELLLGQIANTDAKFLSQELSKLGIDVYFHTVVGDNRDRLKEALTLSLKRADLVILSGGLGPTQDDLTKETVAEYFGLPLEMHEESLTKIKDYFKSMNREMIKSNEKQAMLPKGCIVMKNDNGTAPGCIIEKDGKIAAMMPGPPSELELMFLSYLKPYLKEKSDSTITSDVLRIFGMGESAVEEKIVDIINAQTNPTIAPYAKEGETTLRISAKAASEDEGRALIAPVKEKLYKLLGNLIYAEGDDNSLAKTVVNLLNERGTHLAVAESCTGGMVAKSITDCPGASKSFMAGFVTYSNEAKINSLGVSEDTLSKYGAVSEQTAIEMAKGAQKAADIAVSTTGIAGPDGGTEEKKVGLVYIALSNGEKEWVSKLNIAGNRERVRTVTTLNVFDLIRKYILGEL